MRTLYTLDSVVQEYAGRRVLEIERLNVESGEILSIVGPSGAGKSTLLRLLAFVESPAAGQIHFRDELTRGPETPIEVRRRVAMVFQRPALLSRSVADNVAYGLRVRGVSDAPARVDAALAQVGLTDLALKSTARLSGGEAQRVALARALVVNPDGLLLDEPTANLDPYNVGLIESILRDYNAAHGKTVVLVTHNVFQAKRLAARAGLLLSGRLVEVAPAREFFESPGDPRTAAFVRGEMVY